MEKKKKKTVLDRKPETVHPGASVSGIEHQCGLILSLAFTMLL